MSSNFKMQNCMLAEYLSKVLGPTYRIAYYDASDIQNMSAGFSFGYDDSPDAFQMADLARKLLSEASSSNKRYLVNVSLPAISGFNNNFFVMNGNDGEKGVMVISYNVSLRKKIISSIASLLNVEENEEKGESGLPSDRQEQRLDISNHNIPKTVHLVLQAHGISPGQSLTPEQKNEIIIDLYKQHIFMIKGAVPVVAKMLNTSAATLYRYLSKLNAQNNNAFWEPVKLI